MVPEGSPSFHFHHLQVHQNMPTSPNPSQAIQPSSWKPLVVTLVGTIGTVFLLLSYCSLLRRHCCSFQGITFSQYWPQRQLLNEENHDDPSLQFQSRGLDSYIMHSIPITQFKKKSEEEESGQTNMDCAVCLGEFEEGEWIKNLPNCSHAFHVACIDTWFQTHSSCPLCRSYVFDLAVHDAYSVSVYSLLETLRREDFVQDRSAHYQVVRSQILQSSSLRIDPQNASSFI